MKILENKQYKICRSENYNYNFDKVSGYFERWGKTKEDDPQVAPGPEILDIELSSICHGTGKPCSFCYKSNTPIGQNMSFETFKKIFHKFSKSLTQIAFGIGDIDGNPALFDIMNYCRAFGIIPNITINGYRMTEDYFLQLAKVCGAVAASCYDKDTCYNTVSLLIKKAQNYPNATLSAVNIHQLLCEETFDKCFEVMKDSKTDERLKDLGAIVFLLLKPKGARNYFHSLKDPVKYKQLIDYALDNGIKIGFDSCQANWFLKAVKGHANFDQLSQVCEPCESTCFSLYVDVNAKAYPCSFSVGCEGVAPIDLLEVKDFITEVWNAGPTCSFRDRLLSNGRKCPLYNIEIGE